MVLTHSPEAGESVEGFARRLGRELAACSSRVLLLLAYGACSAAPGFRRGLAEAAGATEWPLQWVEGAACGNSLIAGVQTFVLEGEGGDPTRIRWRGRVLASVWEDGVSRHCLLGGLEGRVTLGSPEEQASAVFSELEEVLAMAELSLADVARTWFYNHRILEWYEAFNAVRNRHYRNQPFRTGSLPASTAVEARHESGGALQLAVWAVRPLGAGCESVCEVASPLQCPAPQYGSSFSRAVELSLPGARRVLVSGTASIEPGGRTVWRDEPERQIELSLDVVEALLSARGMAFSHCDRAVAYLKEPGFLPLFEQELRRRGHGGLPFLAVHCDICRDDLLFEIEVDAQENQASSPSRRSAGRLTC